MYGTDVLYLCYWMTHINYTTQLTMKNQQSVRSVEFVLANQTNLGHDEAARHPRSEVCKQVNKPLWEKPRLSQNLTMTDV